MRLLRLEADGRIALSEWLSDFPPYAVLSHTWGTPDEEVLFQDILNGTAIEKKGYRKIEFCGKQAASDGLNYFWVDTCCINRWDSTELSESINSMFRWYQNAARCYAYLSDVSTTNEFEKSRWFTRGWTLQELLAPKIVEFFSQNGDRLGDKKSLEAQIHAITKINIHALRGVHLSEFPVKERMSWARGRQTAKQEDTVYCLLGVFGVFMPLIYGEGQANAHIRLSDEIGRRSGRQFTPVYAEGQWGDGIGTYDLRSPKDRVFAFDYDNSGKLDHLVLYRPGSGVCYILKNEDGSFEPVRIQSNKRSGIGGYDLRSFDDRLLAFDYNHSGHLSHIVCYRPGTGICMILENEAGSFKPVPMHTDGKRGIGCYDLKSVDDRMFAFDYDHSGKMDHLCLYRPGTGMFCILKNADGVFSPVYYQSDPGPGIGGYALKSKKDRAFAFDWDSSGKMDHIVLYCPGPGTFCCLRNSNGSFQPVVNKAHPERGIGGYDLASTDDKAFAFDWSHSGKNDYLVLYRPGGGTCWALSRKTGTFIPVFQGGGSPGLGGYDLSSNVDRLFSFDYDHSGRQDYIVANRRNGTGTIWILRHN